MRTTGPLRRRWAGRPTLRGFHTLRHSYVALLDRAGATLKEAMHLARHSDPKLTMKVYDKARLGDLANAIDRLPSLTSPESTNPEAVELAAKGTDGRGVELGKEPKIDEV